MQRDEKVRTELEILGQRYGLDFAGNLEKVFHGETLYRTIEYMRKHRKPETETETGKNLKREEKPDGT